MDGFRRFCDIRHKTVSFLFTDIYDFTDMVFVCHDTSSRFALLLEQNQLAHIKITDLDTELRQKFSTLTITASTIIHHPYPPFPPILSISEQAPSSNGFDSRLYLLYHIHRSNETPSFHQELCRNSCDASRRACMPPVYLRDAGLPASIIPQ